MHMKPKSQFLTIEDNLNNIESFITEIIIKPKNALSKWARLTNQTPAAKIGYIGQHLSSLITGVQGTGSGARGDDLSDGSEVKSCNKVDQADKCRNCGSRVLRIEDHCSSCGSTNIERKDDSKWLFTVRDEHELQQYLNMDRIVLLLMDYPKFEEDDFRDIRITSFEIYPNEKRMEVFNKLISNHYYNIYLPKANNGQKTNPMNLHPWSFQFYKCNPIKTFECIIKNIDTNPEIQIDRVHYISPSIDRDNSIAPIQMPTSLLRENEWREMISKADYNLNIKPLIDKDFLANRKLESLTEIQFSQLSIAQLKKALPYIDQTLRDFISLRPIVSTRQKQHYQRG